MPFITMSASKSDLSTMSNMVRSTEFETSTRRYKGSYRPATGYYEGVKERSYIWHKNFPEAIAQANHFAQDSVLIVDHCNKASLLYLRTLQIIPLGTFQPVSKSYALQQQAWTRLEGVYYVCE